MIKGFWKQLKRPFFVLAPMANVTDAAFRQIIAKYGKPDVLWTEFVSTDALCSDAGRKNALADLWFDPSQRPIVAQIFGSKPDNFYKSAQLIQALGFDGIDLNMGCPDKGIEKSGAGARLIKEPKLAQEIIRATIKGAGPLPVSVKTRLGYSSDNLEEWLKYLLETGPAAITIHARTRKEMSLTPASWERVQRAVEIAREFDPSENRTLILGNGDLKSLEDAQQKVIRSGADGAMIGRGIFGNPWFFNADAKNITLEQKLGVMLEHTSLFEQLFKGIKSFEIMKKHFKAYVSDFDGAKELRMRLMAVHSAAEIIAIVKREYPLVQIPTERLKV